MVICEVCKTNEAMPYALCHGDGRLHHHGMAHTRIVPGYEGQTNHLAHVCLECNDADKEAWDEARKAAGAV